MIRRSGAVVLILIALATCAALGCRHGASYPAPFELKYDLPGDNWQQEEVAYSDGLLTIRLRRTGTSDEALLLCSKTEANPLVTMLKSWGSVSVPGSRRLSQSASASSRNIPVTVDLILGDNTTIATASWSMDSDAGTMHLAVLCRGTLNEQEAIAMMKALLPSMDVQ